MSIILGEDQKRALDEIIQFIKSDSIAYSLVGYAGTGKSLLIKHIVDYLEKSRIQYVLAVPTHKAKTVLERFTEREGLTLHKLLSLAPNIEILHLDFKDLQFHTHNNTMLFPFDGVVICDESSMINDELFDLLISKCKSYGSKIIFVGDSKQLKPVNSLSTSKVFDLEEGFTLTKIYRQQKDSGLSTVLPTLRENVIGRFSPAEGEDGSLLCYSDTRNFLTSALKSAQKAIGSSDILETKVLAYTNDRVNAYNQQIKKILFGETEYSKLGMITGNDNIEFDGNNFWNSMDYVIVDEPEKTQINIPNFIKLPGYRLSLYDSSYKVINTVNILSREVSTDYRNSLSMFIEDLRVDAINKKKRRNYRGASLAWRDYYSLMKSFTTPFDLYYDGRLIRKKSFDYGYATTVHKSQGSSINNVFIDMKNISICRDREELRQLQYVSVSRARTNAHILQ